MARDVPDTSDGGALMDETAGRSALAVVLDEMQRWQVEHGRACGVIRLTSELMTLIEVSESVAVMPVGFRREFFLLRVPGVPADFLVDPTRHGYEIAFELLEDSPLNVAQAAADTRRAVN